MKTTDRNNNSESGFSMVELLVSMAILGIIAAIAMPNFIAFKQNSQLGAATRELFSGFQQAKMTAIKRNTNCTITFNQPVGGTTYDYIVYVDTDNDLEYDPGEKVIVSQLWEQSANISSTIPFVNNDEGRPSIAFNPYGLPKDNAGNLGNGTITLTNTTSRVKNLELSIVGNVKIAS